MPPRTADRRPRPPVDRGLGWTGTEFEVTVGPVAHGGHCVARHEGRVVFVRHALPGERVVARVTEDRHPGFCRADAVEVLEASADRVERPCPYSGPGLCGGCDWQHAAPAAQRALKAAVVREQLARLAGLDIDVTVEELSGGPLRWRSRARFAVDRSGAAGLRRHRSHDVVEPGQPRELLADDRRLELPLRGGVDVLPVAATAPAGPAVRAGPLDPVGRGLEDLDGVGAAEARVAVLGDPHDHPLARQGVPDEDDPALVPRNAVPAVGDGTHSDVELGADPSQAPLQGPAASLRAVGGSGVLTHRGWSLWSR